MDPWSRSIMLGRVVVAMSGGVDSSVAAALLKEQGKEVIGIGLRFPDATRPEQQATCCGMAGMEDARRVAACLDIPFYVLDYRGIFEREVIVPFCRAYAHGTTPNPCILCNNQIKFGALLNTALALGADCIATGHYARLISESDTGRRHLFKGRDGEHDQSYFLSGLTQQQMAHVRFPVGELAKPQVRRIAAQLSLPIANKPGSQDICFVGEGGYPALVATREPEAERPGPILDLTGRTLGWHQGFFRFTLGQRQGLGISAREPLYVVGLDPVRQAVIVGPKAATYTDTLFLDQVNWLADDPPDDTLTLITKTRYRGPEALAKVRVHGTTADVSWVKPHPRVAAGQAVVFYEGERVMGSGTACAPR